jgi:hypothetical protein
MGHAQIDKPEESCEGIGGSARVARETAEKCAEQHEGLLLVALQRFHRALLMFGHKLLLRLPYSPKFILRYFTQLCLSSFAQQIQRVVL